MPKRHKDHQRCSKCGHCRTWRVNKAFVRTTKANGAQKKYFKVCNHCSRVYRKTGPLTEDDFRKKYQGSDHLEYVPQRFMNFEHSIQDQGGLLTEVSCAAPTPSMVMKMRRTMRMDMTARIRIPMAATTTTRVADQVRAVWVRQSLRLRHGLHPESLNMGLQVEMEEDKSRGASYTRWLMVDR